MEAKPLLPHADESVRMLNELRARNPLPPPTGLRGLRPGTETDPSSPSSVDAPAAAMVMTRKGQPSTPVPAPAPAAVPAPAPGRLTRPARPVSPMGQLVPKQLTPAAEIINRVEPDAGSPSDQQGSAAHAVSTLDHEYMSARERFCSVNWERSVPSFEGPGVTPRVEMSAKGRFVAVNWDRSDAPGPGQRNQAVPPRTPRASVDGLFSEIDW
jgi:hypothetical protein